MEFASSLGISREDVNNIPAVYLFGLGEHVLSAACFEVIQESDDPEAREHASRLGKPLRYHWERAQRIQSFQENVLLFAPKARSRLVVFQTLIV